VADNEPQPFLLNPQTGRKYYGKALGLGNKEEVWTDRDYESGFEESHSYSFRAAAMAGMGGAYAAMRSSPFLWDTATQAARAVEDYALPFRWGRTFQVSNILSHREATVQEASKKGQFFDLAKQGDRKTANYIHRLQDSSIDAKTGKARDIFGQEDILKKGVTFKDGKLYLGSADDGKILVQHAGVIRMQEGASNTVGDSYVRSNLPGASNNVPSFNQKTFTGTSPAGNPMPNSISPQIAGMPIQFIGGKSKFQYHWRRAKAIGAEFGIYRFNRLLSEDFTEQPATKWMADKLANMPYLGKYFQGDWKGLGVSATTPGRTAWKLGKKLAVIGTAVPLAYDQLDWMVEQTIGTGITESIATAGVAAHLGYAHVLDALEMPGIGDVYDLQDGLNEWVPGLVDMYNIPKLGLGGMLLGGLSVGGYERFQAVKRASSIPGNQSWGEKFNIARADLSKRYTEHDFEDSHFLGKQFEKWGTFRPGSWYANTDEGKFGAKGAVTALWKAFTTPAENAGTAELLDLRVPFTNINLGRATVGKLAGFMPAVIGGMLAAVPSIFDILVPDERPEELEDIYAGRQEVAVRRGRFWEFGRGSYEGDDIMYYRPHAFARMKSKYKEKALWQEDVDMSPLRKFFEKEFTYNLEQKHFYDRPYPVTSLPFEDVAFVGPVLANTIGRLIKPVMTMHNEEWLDGEFQKAQDPGYGKSYATELGEAPGKAISPYSASQSLSSMFYQMTEQAGLWGYALESGIDKLTGTPGVMDQYKTMDSFRDVTSASRDFYDLNLGGMGMTNEAYRRLFPSERKYRDTYNPLKNTMASWLPGTGSRGINFQEGDPYTKIAEGEYRLPGVGYAARFSELEGLDPEDYPLIHKFKILADVAANSHEFKKIAAEAKKQRDSFNSFDLSIYESTLEQLEEKRKGREFSEYRNSLMGQGDKYAAESSSLTLAGINKLNAAQRSETTGPLGAIGSAIEWGLHLQSPFEYLLPISPESKFNPRRTSIESYERENVYGTKSAFWNKPFDNFIYPNITSFAHNYAGWKGIPGHQEETRGMDEYFDMLKYAKYTRLSNIAKLNRDAEAQAIFERKKDETLFGMNPYTQKDSSIYRALPSRDRDYFRAFSEADSPEKRKRILELVPRNQRELYLARWKLNQSQDMKKARDGMNEFALQSDEASDRINSTNENARNEGFPKTTELYQLFMQSKYPGENYPDWYRRTQLLPDVNLPGPDWIGWHPSVDLEDIRLKMALETGQDMHDHGFYDTQLRALGSKPFLDEAVMGLQDAQSGDPYQQQRMMNELFATRRIQADIGISKEWGPGSRQTVSLDMEE
jgi:hypothetical protein